MTTPRRPDEPVMLQPSIAQLGYLVAVADAPTFAAAAAGSGVSTSALSQGLAELERRLGVPLFERQGRRQVLRGEAGEVLAYARRVIADTRDLSRWVDDLRGGRAGRLRAGMIDAAAITHFPEQIRAFRRDSSEVDLTLVVAPSAELFERLRRGDLDVVVAVEPESPSRDLDVVRVVEEELVVVPPEGVAIGDASQWGPWVLFPTGSHTRAVIERELRRRGAPVEVVAESHQPEVLREMARLSMGWTVLPAAHPSGAGVARGAAGRPVVLTTRRLVVARASARAAHPAVDRFVDLLHPL